VPQQHAQEVKRMQIESDAIDGIIQRALAEDVGTGDVTSELLIPKESTASATFAAREPMVACGMDVASHVFMAVDGRIQTRTQLKAGQRIQAGEVLLEVEGPARGILTGERTALNLMQRMCSVATLTRQYANAIEGTSATILDTRKTMPGLRILDKQATKAGGAENHRMGLYDRILIKDNHIAVLGTVTEAIQRAKAGRPQGVHIQVECDNLTQVVEAFEAGPDSILLDNMELHQLRQAVELCKGSLPLEASGNVNLETVREIAETGVNFISIGRLTHSAPCVDIGLDIEIAHAR